MPKLCERLRFWWFAVLAWVLVSIDSLDGMRGNTEFSVWRLMAAWYVFGFGVLLLVHGFHRLPSWLVVLSWSGFGAGLMFWATVASNGWMLWFVMGLGSWYMAARSACNPDWAERGE